MKILIVGDIVGSPGRKVFANTVTRWKADGKIDFVVANAENSAGGRGITPKVADELFSAGADIITLGDHVWDQKDLIPHLAVEQRLVRPANFPPGCPGRGYTSVVLNGVKISVISLIGRVFMPPNDCPFRCADALLRNKGALGDIIIVDFHAEATSEKITLGRYLDGRVSFFCGTHTHVQTSDETILPKGTGYITDLGMTGPKDSSIGRDLESVTKRFLDNMPSQFKVAKDDVVMEGVLISVDERSGNTKKIKRIRERL
ncbi:MAG: TIGR00282 family metallophosphoesterase [Kiritimatiellae bacterium]|jgi:metallophosphoesterase (TIGR00282 family)|nr:TIGR00282 family metallophosphoesterase [Kiritimatiellia bacterium]